MATTRWIITSPDGLDAAVDFVEWEERQRWLLAQSIRSAFLIETDNYQRYTSFCLMGWDTTFLGTFPEFTNVILTQQGAVNRKIQYLITWVGGAVTAVVVQYYDGVTGYVTLANPSITGVLPIADATPVWDFTAPRQTNVINDDIDSVQQALISRWVATEYQGHIPNRYFPLDGTVTPTGGLDADHPDSIVITYGSVDVEMKFEFEYHIAGLFGGSWAYLRQVTQYVKLFSAGIFHKIATFEYLRANNSSILEIREIS